MSFSDGPSISKRRTMNETCWTGILGGGLVARPRQVAKVAVMLPLLETVAELSRRFVIENVV